MVFVSSRNVYPFSRVEIEERAARIVLVRMLYARQCSIISIPGVYLSLRVLTFGDAGDVACLWRRFVLSRCRHDNAIFPLLI